MKYISGVLFIAALVWSWCQIHSSSIMSFESVISLHNQLSELIYSELTQAKPTVTDFHVNRMWTEIVNENNIKVNFTYEYKEPNTTEQNPTTNLISGEALLEKKYGISGGENVWVKKSFKLLRDEINFKESLLIDPNEVELPQAESEAPPVKPPDNTLPQPTKKIETPTTVAPSTQENH